MTTTPAGQSARPVRIPLGFTGPDIPAADDLANCIHCGFCLPSCPTYVATGSELESPRGRLHLISGIRDGRIEAIHSDDGWGFGAFRLEGVEHRGEVEGGSPEGPWAM